MKKQFIVALTSLCLMIAASAFAVQGQTSDLLPTLRGEKAVEQLKQSGQYDSLMEAVKQARKENNQTEEENPEDAVRQSAKLLASDGASEDQFGSGVAISGNTAIIGANDDDVGANTDQGSAYIFVRSGTAWSQQQQLTASDGGAYDYFGSMVAISGDTAIIGADRDDIGTNTDQGSAYVFVRSGTAWSQQRKLTASDGAADDDFGSSVSISGDTAVIGADKDDVETNMNQGSAYIFVRSGTTWSQQQQLTASDGGELEYFGCDVAISGDTAVVGTRLDNVGANSYQSSAYVFVRSGTTWSQQQKLTASDGAAGDQFGYSVSISGGTVVVGAPFDNVGANTDQGSAYVFVRSGTAWSQQRKLTASDGAAHDYSGFSVSISGDTVVIGAYLDDVGTKTDQGSAYVFVRSGTAWSQQQKLTASDGAASDVFGNSVAISGDTIIVGAVHDDVGTNRDQGSAYIFCSLCSNWSQEAKKVAADGAANDQFGFSVSISGDTAVIGAYLDDVGANSDQGSVYVFVRSGTAWSLQQQLTASDGAASDQFGYSVSISGDTIVVGAPFDDVGANGDQGTAYVFVRSATGTWSQQQKLTASDGAADDWFGWSVAISGDTAVVGVVQDDVGFANQGSAYVFTRSGTAWSQQQQLLASDGAASDQFGFSVSISGDTAVIGAIFDDVGANPKQGSAYVFIRNGTAWSQHQKLTDTAGAADDLFGWSVSISGDKIVFGAPYSDAAVSTPRTSGVDDGNDLAPMAADQGAGIFFVNTPLTPTAASVTVSGRVLSAVNRAVSGATVYLTDSDGVTKTARTNQLGYYRFKDVSAGRTYVFNVSSKRYSFQPQIVTVTEEIENLNFTAEQ